MAKDNFVDSSYQILVIIIYLIKCINFKIIYAKKEMYVFTIV